MGLRHISRLIDWRFLAMLVVMIVVATFCWTIVSRGHQIDSLIQISQRETTDAATARREKSAGDLVAAQEIAALNSRIVGLQQQGHANAARSAARDRAIFVYLHRLGVTIPAALLNSNRAGSATRPKVPPATRPRPRHRRHPGTPGPHPGTPSTGIADLCVLLQLIC